MRQSLSLLTTAYTPEQLPNMDEPQIAMTGRSNVGKSTLINALAGRKALAKTSSTPGKTRSVNFFAAQPSGVVLVDLPGYGYAKRSKKERAFWGKLIDRFLTTSPNLKAAALLIDARHTPQALDKAMAETLTGLSIPIICVFTKADKCKQKDHAARFKEWKPLLPPGTHFVLFSGVTGLGREELWSRIASFAD